MSTISGSTGKTRCSRWAREDELRHTIGARLFGNLERFDLNLEGAWQWGSFGSQRIRAWTLSADIGYSLQSLPGSPRLGLKADAISGDHDPSDRTLGTFNPLFPRLPYFSEANIATPANLLDIQPSISFTLPRDVTATLSWNGLRKYAKGRRVLRAAADAGTRNYRHRLELHR